MDGHGLAGVFGGMGGGFLGLYPICILHFGAVPSYMSHFAGCILWVVSIRSAHPDGSVRGNLDLDRGSGLSICLRVRR